MLKSLQKVLGIAALSMISVAASATPVVITSVSPENDATVESLSQIEVGFSDPTNGNYAGFNLALNGVTVNEATVNKDGTEVTTAKFSYVKNGYTYRYYLTLTEEQTAAGTYTVNIPANTITTLDPNTYTAMADNYNEATTFTYTIEGEETPRSEKFYLQSWNFGPDTWTVDTPDMTMDNTIEFNQSETDPNFYTVSFILPGSNSPCRIVNEKGDLVFGYNYADRIEAEGTFTLNYKGDAWQFNEAWIGMEITLNLQYAEGSEADVTSPYSTMQVIVKNPEPAKAFYLVSWMFGDNKWSTDNTELTLDNGLKFTQDENNENVFTLDFTMPGDNSFCQIWNEKGEFVFGYNGGDMNRTGSYDLMYHGGDMNFNPEWIGKDIHMVLTYAEGSEVEGQAYPVTTLNISVSENTAVELVGADNEAAEYYNLQGVRVANPENGMYIRVANGKAQKVMVK